jgi:Kef-type K+ transport system membrane component KefB
MCALAMTATAVSLTMMSLRSLGLQNSVVATRVKTSAVIDDIGPLIVVAIVIPLAVGGEELSVAGVLSAGVNAVLFCAVVTVIGAWIFPHRLSGWIPPMPSEALADTKKIVEIAAFSLIGPVFFCRSRCEDHSGACDYRLVAAVF